MTDIKNKEPIIGFLTSTSTTKAPTQNVQRYTAIRTQDANKEIEDLAPFLLAGPIPKKNERNGQSLFEGMKDPFEILLED